MKNNKILLSILILFGLFSCEDSLDIKQPGEVDGSVIFTSVTNLNSALLAVYGRFPYTNMVDFVSVWTDEAKLGLTNGGQGINDGSFGYVMNDQSSDAASLWVSYNSVVNLANRVIVGSESVVPKNSLEEQQINDIVAQARFLRSLAIIQMLPFFTTDLSDDDALGLIIFEDVPPTSAKLPRSKNSVAYDLVESDMDFAELNLISRTGVDKLRFASKDACTAIRARMAIYRKQYQLALDKSNELIALYPLSTRANFKNIWTDSNTSLERIFYVSKQVGDGSFAGIWSNVGPGIGKNNWYEFGRGLFQSYNSNDIRRFVYTGLPGDSDFSIAPGISTISPSPDTDPDYRTNDQICIYKYPGKNSVNYLADYKIFRVSEMHLIKVEAQIGLNLLSDAAASIKVLRDARHTTTQPTPNYTSVELAYQDLLLERRRELCFEGHRYVDIKRLGVAANKSFDRYFRDCGLNNSCTPPSNTDHRLTLPVPAIEINANNSIIQNPNY